MERTQRLFDPLAKARQVVTALQQKGDPPRAKTLGGGCERPGDGANPVCADSHATEWIVRHQIEAGGHQDQVRSELLQNPGDESAVDRGVLGVALATGEGDVDRGPGRLAAPGLHCGATPRIQGVLVRGDVEGLRIVPKGALGPVAMVHVEVHHRDALMTVDYAGVSRGDRDAIEEAKAHRPRWFGVMSWRSDEGEGVSGLALAHGVGDGQCSAGGSSRRLEASGTGCGVGVEHETPPLGGGERPEIVAAMDPCQLLLAGETDRQAL